jgi:hypothetical protein
VSDLIWIGNTLYPRWIVFAAVAAVPVTILVVDIIVSIVQVVKRIRQP